MISRDKALYKSIKERLIEAMGSETGGAVPIRSSNWSDIICLDSTAFTSGTFSLIIFDLVFESKAELIYDKSLSGQQLVDEPEALRKFDTKSSLNEVVEAFWLFDPQNLDLLLYLSSPFFLLCWWWKSLKSASSMYHDTEAKVIGTIELALILGSQLLVCTLLPSPTFWGTGIDRRLFNDWFLFFFSSPVFSYQGSAALSAPLADLKESRFSSTDVSLGALSSSEWVD